MAIALLCLLAFSIPFFELRENRRQFYRSLRKLYVCVDMEGFIAAREALLKNALFSSTATIPYTLLNAIEAYYKGELVSAKNYLLKVNPSGDYLFWKCAYLMMLNLRLSDESIQSFDKKQASRLVGKVPKYFRAFAKSRLDLLNIVIEGATVESLVNVRETFGCNLLIAESADLIAVIHPDQRLKAYYFKSAQNLCKGLIFS
ncbi:hypothetical protein [Fusibacter bizertensis]